MSPRANVALLVQAVYLPGQSRKKKAMHAMSAVAKAPGSVDVAAMSMVVRRILRGIGHTWLGQDQRREIHAGGG